MAILTNASSYQKYLNRINEYRALKSKDQRYSDIQARTEVLLSELTSRNDPKVYLTLLIGICALSLLVGIVCLILGHYLIGIILTAAPFVSWYFYSTSLKDEIRTQQELSEKNKTVIEEKILTQVQYLLQGVHIKLTRMNIVRLVYMSIFPFLMLGVLLIVQSQLSINLLVLLVIAIIMGSLFWYFYFKTEVDEMTYQKKELVEYEETLILERNNVSVSENQN